eukprot:SAG11_NODE_177_length_13334_cov_9.614280_9_plen_139_part_00
MAIRNLGAVNASEKALACCVSARRSMLVIPGGISEMQLQSEAMRTQGVVRDKPPINFWGCGHAMRSITIWNCLTQQVPVIKRTGFIRASLRHGVCLVPTFGFGVNDLYHPFILRSNTFRYLFGAQTCAISLHVSFTTA